MADFIGSLAMNAMDGMMDDGQFRVGDILFPLTGYQFQGSTASGASWKGIRPEGVATGDLAATMPFATAVDVEIIEPMGADTLVWITKGASRSTTVSTGRSRSGSATGCRSALTPPRISP